MATSGGTKAILAAMIANGGIAIAKFVAYLVTGSASMLAESVHSVADTSNQGLLLLGGKQAKKIADDEHQFGYGRERYFWAFVVALVLFTLGGLYSLYEGVDKLRHPHEISSLGWAIGVLIVGLVLESFSLRTAVVEARKVKGDRRWWDYVRRSRSPELPVVLLEDIGALVGLLIALGGVTLAAVTGDPVWDGVGTVGIGILLLVIASVLTVEMRSLLIGEAATQENIAAIMKAVRTSPGVVRAIDVKTQHVGPEELLVAGKVEFDAGLDMAGIADAIDRCESAIRQAVPIATRIYIEPDIYDHDHEPTPDLAGDSAH
ncbi:MAG: cation transporter [Actinobacteria bacterium]|nr:MAG: cation transporter [Actinomycetota bacterium]